MDTYTLADLERVTGAKRRSLQLWADAEVIQADPRRRAGTGTHGGFPGTGNYRMHHPRFRPASDCHRRVAQDF